MSVAKTVAWNLIPDKCKVDLQQKWKDGNTGYHIHCPDGSTEKDGPSAGLAITTAIVSSMTGIKIKRDVAVTGEIDLDGSALAIGGLVHKLYGAKRAGVTLAMCPVENKQNVDRIKKEYKDLIDENFENAIKLILDSKGRVVVTGIGVVSCLGNNQEEVYKSLINSKSGITFSEEYKEYNLKSNVHGKPNIKLEDYVDRKFTVSYTHLTLPTKA